LSDCQIGKMTAAHLEAVLQIAAESNLAGWRKADYEKLLGDDTAILLVARRGAKVVGFAAAQKLFSTTEIWNIAVAIDARRQKIGNALLKEILQTAAADGAIECWLDVRASNAAALAFYLANRFQIAGRRKNYYSNPPEDAILMTLIFSDTNPKN
jgi:ribosomal-protein-alanine N-acetyltransferase